MNAESLAEIYRIWRDVAPIDPGSMLLDAGMLAAAAEVEGDRGMASVARGMLPGEVAFLSSSHDVVERVDRPRDLLCSVLPYRPSARQLEDWYAAADSCLARHASPAPACWGGQFHVAHNSYVPDYAMPEILDDHHLDLWYCMCGNEFFPDEFPLEEVAASYGDRDRLSEAARRSVESTDENGGYYTEFFPEDYTGDELRELAAERPDLFSEEDLAPEARLREAWEALHPGACSGRAPGGALDRLERAAAGGEPMSPGAAARLDWGR